MVVLASPQILSHFPSSFKIECSQIQSNSLQKLCVNPYESEGKITFLSRFWVPRTNLLYGHSIPLRATSSGPKGFGPAPNKTSKARKSKPRFDNKKDDDDEEDDDEEGPEVGVIPEIVTNRMISRMAFTVGIPLFTGLLFFPLFYYLKVVLKIDVPSWVPLIVSFFFFGTALAGVSYGIVSSSWDPLREGSLVGWNEARKNWPVFLQSFRGKSAQD